MVFPVGFERPSGRMIGMSEGRQKVKSVFHQSIGYIICYGYAHKVCDQIRQSC